MLLSWIPIFIYISCLSLYNVVLSLPSSLVITCLKRADLLVLFNIAFSFVSVTFPYGVTGQVLTFAFLSTLLELCSWCCVAVSVMCLFLEEAWVGLGSVMVAFLGHTHLLLYPNSNHVVSKE